MNITITGTIKQIFQSEVFGNFEKRVFWVEETTDKYPNTYQLEFQQGECNRLDSFKSGDQVECSVDVRGRWYSKNGKEGVINSLKCWRLIKQGQQAQQPSNFKQSKTYTEQSNYQVAEIVDPNDDLPF